MKHWRKLRGRAENHGCGSIRFHLYIREDADAAFWQQIAAKYLTNGLAGLQTVPSSGNACVQTGRIPGTAHRHFFKRFFPRDRLEYLKQLFRKSRAYRDLKGTETAASRGLGVPEIKCAIETRKWGITTGSCIITREVEGAAQLRKWLEKFASGRDVRTRRATMRQLGTEMARWHQARMRHGDARDSNILCRIPDGTADSGKPQGFEFCWLDNERSRVVWRKRDLIRNLVQLNMTRTGVTTTDRMRFWNAYWADAATVYHPRSRESVLREVIAKTRKRWAQRGWL